MPIVHIKRLKLENAQLRAENEALKTSAKPHDPAKARVLDHGKPEYLDGAQCQYSIERGEPYPNSDTLAYVFDKDLAEKIAAFLNDTVVAPTPENLANLWLETTGVLDTKHRSEAFGMAVLESYGQPSAAAEQAAWHAGWQAARDALPAMPTTRVQDILMSKGFKVKPGENGLKDYVFEAAYALIAVAQGRSDLPCPPSDEA